MTCHTIQFKCSTAVNGDNQRLVNSIRNWAEGHSETKLEESIGPNKLEQIGSGIAYFALNKKFEDSDNEVSLISGLEKASKDKVEWYIIKYHLCNHDDSSNKCSWDIINKYGNPPSDI